MLIMCRDKAVAGITIRLRRNTQKIVLNFFMICMFKIVSWILFLKGLGFLRPKLNKVVCRYSSPGRNRQEGKSGMRWRVGIVLRFEADGGIGVDVITGCVEQYGGRSVLPSGCGPCGVGQPGGLHHVGRLFCFQYVTVVVAFVPFQLLVVVI